MNLVDREKRARALELAIESGAVKSCELHEDVHIDNCQLDAALEHGSKQFDAGKLSGVFTDKDDMDDHIRKVVEDTLEVCWVCDRHN